MFSKKRMMPPKIRNPADNTAVRRMALTSFNRESVLQQKNENLLQVFVNRSIFADHFRKAIF